MSAALIRSSGTQFSQQGSVDWVSLSRETVSFTVGILARLSAHGIDPYTLVVGRALCKNFRLLPEGRRNVESAVSKLSATDVWGGVLRFGFGITSLPKQLTTTEEGTVCVALCAAMSEFYHEDIGAEILFELTKLNELPEDFAPAMSEWRSLLRVFQGVFAASEFPLMIDQIWRLGEQPSPLVRDRHDAVCLRRGRAHPKSIAKALNQVKLVSSNLLARLEITGSFDVAWLAAISIWIFGLQTKVSNSRGEVIFANCQVNEAKLHFSIQPINNNSNSQDLQQSVTFRLDTGSHLISHLDMRLLDVHSTGTGGRVEWNICLSSVFGHAFLTLSQKMDVVGTVIGSAASVLTQNFDKKDGCFNNVSHGREFVGNILKWFPELAGAKAFMEKALHSSSSGAQFEFDAHVDLLKVICTCSTCLQSTQENCVDDSQSNGEDPLDQFRLPAVIQTVIWLTQWLSFTHVAEGLLPTRAGFEQAYLRSLTRHDTSRIGKTRPSPARFILPEQRCTGDIISKALELFTGCAVFGCDQMASAYTQSGICVFLDSLRSFSDNIADGFILHVVPGTIEHRSKPYRLVRDKVFDCGFMTPPRFTLDHKVSLLVSPAMEHLNVELEIQHTGIPPVIISPAFFTWESLCVKRPKRCTQQNCSPAPICDRIVVTPLHHIVSSPRRSMGILYGDALYRAAYIFLHSRYAFVKMEETVILATNACFSCSIKFAGEFLCNRVTVIRDQFSLESDMKHAPSSV